MIISIKYNSLHRSPFLVFSADEHYKEYLEDVVDHCSEPVEQTAEEGKNIITLYNQSQSSFFDRKSSVHW